MTRKKLSPATKRQDEQIQNLMAENSITELERLDKCLTEQIDVEWRKLAAAYSRVQAWWIERARMVASVWGERLDWPDAKARLARRYPATFARCEELLRLVCRREQVREAKWWYQSRKLAAS